MREWGVLSFAWLSAAFLLLPFHTRAIRVFGDNGFTYLAHVHDLAGTPWGTVTAHTSGVFAIMRFDHYCPGTFWKLMAGNGLLALVIGSVLGWVAARHVRDWAVGVFFVSGSMWMLWLSTDAQWLFLVLAWVLFLPDFGERRVTAPFLTLTLMAAFAFHVKGTFAIAVLGVVPLLFASELRARRWPLNTGVLFACVFGLNALGQSTPASMWEHLRYVVAALPCYPEAFSHPGPWRQWLLFVAVHASFELLLLARACSRKTWLAVLRFLTYSLVLWLVFRTSFTRHDPPHVARAWSTLLPFAACWCFVHRQWFTAQVRQLGRVGEPGRVGRLVPRVGWLVAIVLAVATQEVRQEPIQRLITRARTIERLATEGVESLERRHRGAMMKVRKAHPLPDWLKGPVGVFGMAQTPVVAHGLENAPMPIVAAYEIWNLEGMRRTNAWLEAEDAPRFLVHTSAGSSARSQITLAERYGTAHPDAPRVLRRLDSPLQAVEERMLEGTTTWSRRLAVPTAAQDTVLMLRLSYRRTWLNRLLTAVHQPALVVVVLYQDDRVLARVRVNRHLVGDGLILNTRDLTNFDARPSALLGLRHDLLSDLDRELAVTRGEGRRSERAITAFSVEGGMPRDDGIVISRDEPPGDRFTTRFYPATSWEGLFEPEIRFELVRVRFVDGFESGDN